MKVKTNELEGELLNQAVAEASETPIYISGKTLTRMDMDGNVYWQPTTDWSQAGPIIEREKMRIAYNFDEHIWEAGWDCHVKGWGDTPLVAAMRAYVASVMGEEIQFLENEVA
jgi:hypothetical protein